MINEQSADKCPSCGAPIRKDRYGGYVCSYCGTQKAGTVYADICPNGYITLHARATAPTYLPKEYFKECITHALAGELADALLKHMEYYYNYDAMRQLVDVEGVIFIKKPGENDKKCDFEHLFKTLEIYGIYKGE
jgi:predicted RNA-binding Zn-ribbon protein involved in translation (DUF1610 family)